MSELSADLARARTAGAPVGVTSVCSAHPLVLEAAVAQASEAETLVEAFERAGLHEAWGRVRALVVQPGVEFDHARVVDHQRPEGLARLVQDGWAVLKVGPGLTLALREALSPWPPSRTSWLAPSGHRTWWRPWRPECSPSRGGGAATTRARSGSGPWHGGTAAATGCAAAGRPPRCPPPRSG